MQPNKITKIEYLFAGEWKTYIGIDAQKLIEGIIENKGLGFGESMVLFFKDQDIPKLIATYSELEKLLTEMNSKVINTLE